MKKYEIERVKEILEKVLELWVYQFVSASTEDGRSLSMSKEEFLKQVEHMLKTY